MKLCKAVFVIGLRKNRKHYKQSAWQAFTVAGETELTFQSIRHCVCAVEFSPGFTISAKRLGVGWLVGSVAVSINLFFIFDPLVLRGNPLFWVSILKDFCPRFFPLCKPAPIGVFYCYIEAIILWCFCFPLLEMSWDCQRNCLNWWYMGMVSLNFDRACLECCKYPLLRSLVARERGRVTMMLPCDSVLVWLCIMWWGTSSCPLYCTGKKCFMARS